MKLEPFKIEHLGAFIPNAFSDPDGLLDQLTDPNYEVQTLWGDNGLVEVILCFRNYWGRCWAGFFLVSQLVRPAAARFLRRHIALTMQQRGAQRLQTDSQATECLRKWHQFMGFTLEGTRQKLLHNRDYDCWAIVKEG